MAQSNRERLDAIERDLLSSVALSDCLRACVALALAMDSTPLREWAERELNGYRYADVPEYRHAQAVVVGDIVSVAGHDLRNQVVPAERLPEVYDQVTRVGLPLHLGLTDVGPQLDRLARDGSALHITIMDAALLTQHLNDTGVLNPGARYTDVRYQISEAALRSVVERIRTRALHVLHEIRALTPANEQPTDQAGGQAVNLVINSGNGHQFNVTTTQAQHGDASTTHAGAPGDTGVAVESLRWTKRQTRWTVFGGIIAVISLVVGAYSIWIALDGG